MESRICGRHKGFSLVEIAVVLLLFGVAAAYMVISPNVAKQTAKHEAERLQEYIFSKIAKADKINATFTLSFTGNSVSTKWLGNNDYQDSDYRATAGCKYEDNFNGNCEYMPGSRNFLVGGHIQIWDSDGEEYYVIIAATEGRIRISPTLSPTDP